MIGLQVAAICAVGALGFGLNHDRRTTERAAGVALFLVLVVLMLVVAGAE